MNTKVIYVNDKGYITSIKSGFISAGGQVKKYIKNIKNILIKKKCSLVELPLTANLLAACSFMFFSGFYAFQQKYKRFQSYRCKFDNLTVYAGSPLKSVNSNSA